MEYVYKLGKVPHYMRLTKKQLAEGKALLNNQTVASLTKVNIAFQSDRNSASAVTKNHLINGRH